MTNFNLIDKGNYADLVLLLSIENDIEADLERLLSNEIVPKKFQALVLNFSNITEFSPAAYRIFGTILRKYNYDKKIVSYKVNHSIVGQLKKNGVLEIFNVCNSLDAGLDRLGIKRKKIALSATFINPFIQATLNTFGIQANVKITVGTPFRSTDEIKEKIGIAGIIGITSEIFNGSMTLAFPAKSFLYIYNSMLGTEETEINVDIEDAAGEFTNIVLGAAKSELNKTEGHAIGKAIPSIVSGESISIRNLSSGDILVIPFIMEQGKFYLYICIESN